MKVKNRVASTVVFHFPAEMTAKGKHEIALWLRRIGAELEKNAQVYTKHPEFNYRY